MREHTNDDTQVVKRCCTELYGGRFSYLDDAAIYAVHDDSVYGSFELDCHSYDDQVYCSNANDHSRKIRNV